MVISIKCPECKLFPFKSFRDLPKRKLPSKYNSENKQAFNLKNTGKIK